jgi:hypothetical protein
MEVRDEPKAPHIETPRLAILFWWYKEPEICADRLRLLRRLNPDLPIYGLYGGPPQSGNVSTCMPSLLDDDWAYAEDRSAEWKWHHGDLMLSAWYRERGMKLAWDTLVIMQWDMLALAPLRRIFGNVARDEIFLPGLRAIEEVGPHWWWTRPGTPQHDEFMRFREMMAARYGFKGPYLACQFVTGIMPRGFMEGYVSNPEPELGFLEYKMPAFASCMGLKLLKYPGFDVVWPMDINSKDRVTLTAAKREVGDALIASECLKPTGARLFHPVSRHFPSSRLGFTAWMARTLAHRALGLS